VIDEEVGGQQDRTLTPIHEDATPAAPLTEADRQMLNALAHEDFVRRKRQKEVKTH